MIMKHESQALHSPHDILLPERFSVSFCRNSVIAEMEFLERTKERLLCYLALFKPLSGRTLPNFN